MINHLLGLFDTHLVHLRELFKVIAHTGLLEVEKELCLLLGQNRIQSPILRIIGFHGICVFHKIPVGDHCTELQNQFFLFRIGCLVVSSLSEITVVDHPVQLVFHLCVLHSNDQKNLPIRSLEAAQVSSISPKLMISPA